MKLRIATPNSEVDIELRCEGPRVLAAVDNRNYELELHEPGDGNYLLLSEGRVLDCHVEGRPESGGPFYVLVGTRSFLITVIDPKRLRGSAGTGGYADGAVRIVAPMPGKVVRVLAALGDRVEAGAAIAVVEAMKMQNEMKSPKAGTIVALNVEVGATVNREEVLAIIE